MATVVIQNQPASQGMQQNVTQWTTGLFGCFEDCGGCKFCSINLRGREIRGMITKLRAISHSMTMLLYCFMNMLRFLYWFVVKNKIFVPADRYVCVVSASVLPVHISVRFCLQVCMRTSCFRATCAPWPPRWRRVAASPASAKSASCWCEPRWEPRSVSRWAHWTSDPIFVVNFCCSTHVGVQKMKPIRSYVCCYFVIFKCLKSLWCCQILYGDLLLFAGFNLRGLLLCVVLSAAGGLPNWPRDERQGHDQFLGTDCSKKKKKKKKNRKYWAQCSTSYDSSVLCMRPEINVQCRYFPI